ncbi:TonB family protein [Salibacter sp.]|uniref:energy transducer TonB n=1 Tax=Salibacter sp. TaxID=2010995 RepID=UPI00286FD743|nr:TonB family protein [Salibacter sp.]MDR9398002.1 TonB family protein [Salibacter sp.]MDR9486868.1 TonB family protein [Salibacter sp.]
MLKSRNSFRKLNRKRPFFFLIGLIVATSVSLVAFEYRVEEFIPIDLGGVEETDIEDVMIPITYKTEEVPEIKKTNKTKPEPKPQPVKKSPRSEPDPTREVPEIKLPDPGTFDLPEKTEKEGPFVQVEQMPVFGDCKAGLSEASKKACTDKNIFKFLSENITVPEVIKDIGASSTVYVSFVVNENGSVSDVKVLNKERVHPSLVKEAVSTIESMDNWKAGFQGGKAVKVLYRIPIKFTVR